jgi:hypothetical protein
MIIGSDDRPGDPLTLDVPAALLIEGTHDAQYLATSTLGGVAALSPSTPVIVDFTAPGGPVLESLVFPQHANSPSQQDLANLGGTLTARLPGYFDAKWGDVIRTYWGEQAGPMHTVQAKELHAGHISFSFDQTFLDQLADGEVQVTYTVTDRAGNVSVVSQPVVITLNLKNQPGDLLPPVVPQAQDGLIDNTDARRGVLYPRPIRRYREGVLGQSGFGRVHTDRRASTANAHGDCVGPLRHADQRRGRRPYGQLSSDPRWSVASHVPVDEGVCKAINVRYTVTHPDNPNTAYSPSQSVRVICRAQLPGGVDVLAAPRFAEANNSNTLTPSIESDITSLTIKPYRNMRVGDQVRISFAGFR